MTYRLLAIAASLHLALACVPVRPGEDMPCPSVPQAPSAAGYVTSPLKSRTENGAKVYYCDLPENLLTVDGNGVGENPPTLTLVCKPNSGMFVLSDGKAVGSEKYVCGIMEVPCTPLVDYNGGPITGVEHSALPAPVMAGSTSTWKCAAPQKLYKVTNQAPASAQVVPGDASVVCDRLTGMLTVQPAGTPVDPAMEEYVCGIMGCNKCDMSKLLDLTNGACNTQPDFYCEAKPTVSDDAQGCPTVNCAAGTLTVFKTATTGASVVNIMSVMCDNGVWQYDATPLAATDIGFMCAKSVGCDACNVKVEAAYTGMEAMFAMLKPAPPFAKPQCEYTCPASHLLMADGAQQDKVVCQMQSEKVTANTDAGVELTPTNQFSCNKCNCLPAGLTDGSANGLCPFGSICVKPIPVNMKEDCQATCPQDSSAIYQNPAGVVMMSPNIVCNGADWIMAGKDDPAGVTCQFAANKGTTADPPATTPQCPKLAQFACPANPPTCDFSQIVYIDAGLKTARATCKTGSLVTDKTPPGAMDSISCNQQGPWEQGITMANCVMGPSIVADCLAWLTDPTVVNSVDYECTLGTCRLSCKNNMQFKYDLQEVPVKTETAKYINCYLAEPVPVKGGSFVDTTMIKCV